jgi:hypothetical protein
MVSSLLDGGMSAGERENALAHLNSCGACHARFQSAYHLRQSLLEMDQPPIPDELMGRLRVLASHERERRLRRANVSALFRHWASRVWLCFDNMMRPRALPFAGGVISALLLVGVWFPALATKQTADDVPLYPSNSEILRMRAWGYIGPTALYVRTIGAGDAVLELTIDERGRVVDYNLTSGKMTPELGSMILFSRFSPATVFGRPTSGKLVYRLSQISVIG